MVSLRSSLHETDIRVSARRALEARRRSLSWGIQDTVGDTAEDRHVFSQTAMMFLRKHSWGLTHEKRVSADGTISWASSMDAGGACSHIAQPLKLKSVPAPPRVFRTPLRSAPSLLATLNSLANVNLPITICAAAAWVYVRTSEPVGSRCRCRRIIS